ncbi:MAG: hypothetical protein V1834_02785 [Candidatus Micrarchaeota archaeon]
MKKSEKTKLIAVAFLILFLFFWAPWLNDQQIHDRVLSEKGRLDGTIDPDGNLVCDYDVHWIPFGREAASCESLYWIGFWGGYILG